MISWILFNFNKNAEYVINVDLVRKNFYTTSTGILTGDRSEPAEGGLVLLFHVEEENLWAAHRTEILRFLIVD